MEEVTVTRVVFEQTITRRSVLSTPPKNGVAPTPGSLREPKVPTTVERGVVVPFRRIG